MKYPIDGVSYKHTPKFIDRMKDEEKEDNTPYKQIADSILPVIRSPSLVPGQDGIQYPTIEPIVKRKPDKD